MEMHVFPPSSELEKAVDMEWVLEPSLEGPGTTIHRHEVFPSPGMDLVLRFSPHGARMVLIGPRTEAATIELDRAATYLGIRFRAGQAPRLTEAASASLLNGRVEIEQIGGKPISQLASEVSGASEPEAMMRLLESTLKELPPLVCSTRVRKAASEIDSAQGQMQVQDLAQGLGIHPRTLERLFRMHMGMSPRQCIRLVRFTALVSQMRNGRAERLAHLSAACGYADQAHMANDFKRLTGNTAGTITEDYTGRVDSAPRTPVVHRYRK